MKLESEAQGRALPPGGMQLGVFLPISGRAAGPDTLMEAAQSAEAQGFDAIWSADRVVTPWRIQTPYPYSENHEFIVPPDRPFLDSMTCLAFLAGCTGKITLGVSVLVLPYRHPLYWARVAVSIEHLARGRLIMGVGVGWMEEEFAALGVSYKDRGKMTDEQLQVLQRLWTEEHASFDGQFYRFHDLAFFPKPLQQPRIPIWVGGEGTHAQRRAAKYGDAWFPFSRIWRFMPKHSTTLVPASPGTVSREASASRQSVPLHRRFVCPPNWRPTVLN